ncbi:unnamed protein product [Spirodela intermedia]|uniref:Uncharacterized protein n=1 Tax=Spirodela intermedia TaxID=51605 RepID=A0A7I8IRU5_SPIIN|nr:unnamed protein product [Spirodela intermedia]CAA6660464.1 unnamed protein product [Spirodela intermedia]
MGPPRWSGVHRWGNRSRCLCRRRLLFLLALVCLSPVLLALACLSSPFICALALFLRFGFVQDGDGSFLSRCDEDAVGAPLLHQYLEDQLGLVSAAVWDCYGAADVASVDGRGDAR